MLGRLNDSLTITIGQDKLNLSEMYRKGAGDSVRRSHCKG